MKTVYLFAAIAFLALSASYTPVLAVDNSISSYCTAAYAGTGYQRAGGWCEQIAANKSIVATGGGSLLSCAEGYHNVPNDGLGCIPE